MYAMLIIRFSVYWAVFVLGVVVATYIPPAESRARAEEPGACVARWKLLQTINVQSERYLVFALAFSPDGKLIATVSNAGTQAGERNAKLWQVTTGQEAIQLKGHRYPLLAVAFSPDGQTVATSGWGPFVTLWGVATGDERLTIRARTGNVRSLAFSPDGRTIATAAIGKTQFWDSATGDEKPGPIEPSERVFSLKFSLDGNVLVTAGKDAAIKLWDVQTRKVTSVLTGHKETIFCVAFSPDGKTLASGAGNGDNTLRLWDLTKMKEQAILPHTFWVSCVAFSPDGKTLCSVGPGSPDAKGELRLWDVRSGKQLHGPLLEGEGDIRCVAFSPDGQILAAGFKNKVQLWRVPTE
jgi:WD40 repeat protein